MGNPDSHDMFSLSVRYIMSVDATVELLPIQRLEFEVLVFFVFVSPGVVEIVCVPPKARFKHPKMVPQPVVKEVYADLVANRETIVLGPASTPHVADPLMILLARLAEVARIVHACFVVSPAAAGWSVGNHVFFPKFFHFSRITLDL